MRNLMSAAFIAASLSACAQTTVGSDQSSGTASAAASPAGSSNGAGATDAASASVDANSEDYVSTPSRPARCFMTDQVRNFRTDGTSRIFLRTNRQDVFEVTLFAGCRRLSTATNLQIRSQTPWIRNLCVGDRAVVSARVSSDSSCQGRVVRSLTPEQVEALPNRLRP
jgi:hypothetical protein